MTRDPEEIVARFAKKTHGGKIAAGIGLAAAAADWALHEHYKKEKSAAEQEQPFKR
jgi:hypothetical protein